ncbi:MAG: hypothetical protein QMC90_02395 [Dehalococcoidales bacterium]|nr:hypothetical protein [Dehalococcoidales bacterium]
MIGLEAATEKAMTFLSGRGISFIRLKEVNLKGERWIITYEDSLPFVSQREKYIIELSRETGEVIAFRRE